MELRSGLNDISSKRRDDFAEGPLRGKRGGVEHLKGLVLLA